MTTSPGIGIELLQRTNLLKQFIPELEAGIGMKQNQAHSFTVWEHLLRTLQASADKNYPLFMRLSALFHDIGKPETMEISSVTSQPTFYNHEMVGARMTKTILKRLKYSKEIVSQVTMMVRWHMFFSDPDEVTLSAVRRLLVNVGPDNIWDLVNLRVCDRIGTGRPKEQPYRLRKFKAMIEEAQRSPTSVGMLKISGNDLIETFHVQPGRLIGEVLHILLNEVIDEPENNNKKHLLARSEELIAMDAVARETLSKASKLALKEVEIAEIKAIRDKHHVK